MLFIVLEKENLTLRTDADGKTIIFTDYEAANTEADKCKDGLPLRIDIQRPIIAPMDGEFKNELFKDFWHNQSTRDKEYNYTLDRDPADDDSWKLEIYEGEDHGDPLDHFYYDTRTDARADIELAFRIFDVDINEL